MGARREGVVREAGPRPLRILYLMHVDWGWIRQRPHHLAVGLAARHEVEVVYPVSWRRSALVRNPAPIARTPLWQLPLRRRIGWAGLLDRALKRRALAAIARRFRPDVWWITHPRLEQLLPERLPPRAILAYDCMDDAAAFPDLPLERADAAAEARLARRTAVALASSERLAELLVERGFPRAHVSLVRNAGGGALAGSPPPRRRAPGTPLRAAYFGTVSSWIDFDALVAALAALPALTIDLVGPVEARVPSHARLRTVGPVAHERLASLAAAADVLLVPFRRTPLVDSVDPVKMYEYVAFEREILCVRWREVERFAALAHLYDTQEELVTMLREIDLGTRACRASAADRAAFLRENAWEARVAQVAALLERACERGDAR